MIQNKLESDKKYKQQAFLSQIRAVPYKQLQNFLRTAKDWTTTGKALRFFRKLRLLLESLRCLDKDLSPLEFQYGGPSVISNLYEKDHGS